MATSTSGLGSTLMHSGMPNISTMNTSQNDLDHAIGVINRALEQDRHVEDLSDQLQVSKHNHSSMSGMYEHDYLCLADPNIGLETMPEVILSQMNPLPPELLEQFSHMQSNCAMGLFSEISRAWLSIDSDIFIWNYKDGSDLAYFDGLTETVLTAALIQPKKGVFQAHIEYLLCLVTPLDIALFGVSFTKSYTDGDQGEMHLLPEPLFCIPSDNTHFVAIKGTSIGRIFMAGKDGALYELTYQADDGWFSRKCAKKNLSMSRFRNLMPSIFTSNEVDSLMQIEIDESRNVLYTRSERGSLSLYDLGANGLSTSHVATLTPSTIENHAFMTARSVEQSHFKDIISISAIPASESANVHLLAVTSTGVRLYFCVCSFEEKRPRLLNLIHVRMPPGFSPLSPLDRPTKVHQAHYCKGTLLMASTQKDETDLLWVISNSSLPFQRQIIETMETHFLDGRAWAIQGILNMIAPIHIRQPPLVVTQHMYPSQQFVLLTSQGTLVLMKPTPVDQLRELFLRHQSADTPSVISFFSLHGPAQACATCLILASSHNQVSAIVTDCATTAYHVYGGEAQQSYGALPASNKSIVSSPIQGRFHPRQVSTPYQGNQSFEPEFQYSGRHQGLCLYLARLLRPLWYETVVCDPKQELMQSRLDSTTLAWHLELISALRQFMIKNSAYRSTIAAEGFTSLNRSCVKDGTYDDVHGPHKRQQQAQAVETQSLESIKQFVGLVCEYLGLWKVVAEHQMHLVCQSIDKELQKQLRGLTFGQFVSQGRQLSSALIEALIGRYLSDNAATDAISVRLREICPDLYSPQDAICSKANEILALARSCPSQNEKQSLLKSALKQYQSICKDLDLPAVCAHFASLHFYSGIVDLCLKAAGDRDPQNLAWHFYCKGLTEEDHAGMMAFRVRNECYTCLLDALNNLLVTSLAHPQARESWVGSVPKISGPPAASAGVKLDNHEAEQTIEQMLKACFMCEDRMLHVSLYQWLVQNGLSEKLLQQNTPFLEEYLKHEVGLRPDDLATLELLWNYYEKNENYHSAARILLRLAERYTTEISLMQRCTYLSRASVDAKCCSVQLNQWEFLHELEEKLEVARLQLQILEKLQILPGDNPKAAASRLNSQLFDITTLYEEFAEVFDLTECKLAILSCAGHYDEALVESLWLKIVETEIQKSSGDSVCPNIQSKLITLGKVYVQSRYFPLSFLLHLLEQKSCEIDWDITFVFSTFLAVDIPIAKLHKLYDQLIKSKDSLWRRLGKPFHLHNVIVQLLFSYAESPPPPGVERRQFVNAALDSIGNYLIDLQAMTNQTQNVGQLIGDFRAIQALLEFKLN